METQHRTPMSPRHSQVNDRLIRRFGGERRSGVMSGAAFQVPRRPTDISVFQGGPEGGDLCLTERYRWECVRLPQDLGRFPVLSEKVRKPFLASPPPAPPFFRCSCCRRSLTSNLCVRSPADFVCLTNGRSRKMSCALA